MKTQIMQQIVNVSDPQGDQNFALMRVPDGGGEITVLAARVISDTALVGGDTNVVAVSLKSGTTLAGSDVVAAAVTNATGGAAWVAEEARSFTLDSDEVVLQEGDYLIAAYDETGTVAPLNHTYIVDYVQGQRTA